MKKKNIKPHPNPSSKGGAKTEIKMVVQIDIAELVLPESGNTNNLVLADFENAIKEIIEKVTKQSFQGLTKESLKITVKRLHAPQKQK